MKTVHSIIITATLATSLLVPAVSQAHVSVSIGVGLPVVPVVTAPVYAAPPVVVAPAPVVVEPAPVIYEEPRFVPAPPRYYHHYGEWHDGPHWGPHGAPHGWR